MYADYESASQFVQTWVMLFFVIMFVIAAVYALWPKNAGKFKAAASMALNDDADTAPAQRNATDGK